VKKKNFAADYLCHGSSARTPCTGAPEIPIGNLKFVFRFIKIFPNDYLSLCMFIEYRRAEKVFKW